jgi:hypothetical protein
MAGATLHWQVHVKTTTPVKMERVLNRFEEQLRYKLSVQESEPHGTDPQIVIVRGFHPLSSGSLADAVLDTLNVARRVSHWWEILGPKTGPPGFHSLTGLSIGGATRISGVPLAGYDLHYSEPHFGIHTSDSRSLI